MLFMFAKLFENQNEKLKTIANDIKNVSNAVKVIEKVRVTQKDIIEKNIHIEVEKQEKLELCCKVHPAKIFCHSLIIDKLGDLTKFILKSLYNGNSIDEIKKLTQMGDITINEEIDYLKRSGVISEDNGILTELGEEYGKMINSFDELSGGINVWFNTFINSFEEDSDNNFFDKPTEFLLKDNYLFPLTRNDNYSNSRNIAIEKIYNGLKFEDKLKESLYTTVKIDKSTVRYKKLFLSEFNNGYEMKSELNDNNYIELALPCYIIRYKVKYKSINCYRKIASILRDLQDNYSDLLSEKAKKIIYSLDEEEKAEEIVINVVTATGDYCFEERNQMKENLKSNIMKLEHQKVNVLIDRKNCEDIDLEEKNRQKMYIIRYFPYSSLEVKDN